jgi:hypothetical protein
VGIDIGAGGYKGARCVEGDKKIEGEKKTLERMMVVLLVV